MLLEKAESMLISMESNLEKRIMKISVKDRMWDIVSSLMLSL